MEFGIEKKMKNNKSGKYQNVLKEEKLQVLWKGITSRINK